MVNVPGNTEWVAELVPDLGARMEPYVVDTEELDDELVEVFTAEIKRLTTEMKEGLAQNDHEAVRIASHSIKGMGGTMGLPEISVLGLEVENMAKEERLPDAVPLVDALAKWVETLQ